VITVENHLTTGGLGSAIAEVIAEEGLRMRLIRMGLQDEFAIPGSPDYLLKKYKLDSESIVEKVVMTHQSFS
ncbi:transketolase family protein, partial [bacterium]|nr:transketolase family protein [bacterium]